MTVPIVLSERLSSADATELTNQLAAGKSDEVVIDCRGTRTVGALCAERLARFCQDVRADGGTVSIMASPDLEKDMRLLGLHDHLFANEASS